MGNDLTGPGGRRNEYDDYGDDELDAELAKKVNVFTASLVDLAKIVGACFRRGRNLSHLDPKLLTVLRKIECEQILPEMCEQYMHCRAFPFLCAFPLDDQRRLVVEQSVSVVVRRRWDAFDVRRVEIKSLTPDQCRLVFASGRVRTEAEQTAILEDNYDGDDEAPEFPDSIVRFELNWPSRELKALKQRAKREGRSIDDLLHEAAKAKRLI